MKRKLIISASAVLATAVARQSLAQFIFGGFSDVRPGVASNQIVTNAHDDSTGTDVPNVRIFEYRFQNDPGDPYFTQDPGFNAPAGGLPAGSAFSFGVLSSLTYWSGAGTIAMSAPPDLEQLQLNFAVINNCYITGTSGPQPGFTIGNVVSDGSLHKHLNAFLLASDGNADATDGVVATPGIYFTSIRLDDTTASSSLPICLVYNNGLDDASFFSAVKYMRDNAAPGTNLANVTSTWVTDGDGIWSQPTNWDGGVASGISVIASFGSAINSDRTVTVDQPETIGTITFDNSNRYTLAGNGTITLQMYNATAGINILSGSHTITAPLHLASNLLVSVRPSDGTLKLGGTITADPGVQITTTGSGAVQTKNIRADGLSVTGGTLMILSNGTSAATSITKTLSVSTGATLDLTNNAWIVDYTAASPLAFVRSSIASGYASATWTGTGIVSSTAASIAADGSNPHKTAVGYAEASVLAVGSFAGQTVDSTSVLMRYVYTGDANLDGVVNALDFNALASSYGGSGKDWFNGDFNYDGIVNTADFTAIAANFGQAISFTVPPLGSVVPEPASLIAALAALALRRERRCPVVLNR